MIVRPKTGLFTTLFALRGSIVPQVAARVGGITLVSLVVADLEQLWPGHTPNLGPGPFALLGIVLSIFLGFRNNVCYERWWDARRQWGDVVVHLRCLGRDAVTVLDDPVLAWRVVCTSVGFAHALALRLRGRPPDAALDWMAEAERPALSQVRNLPQALLQRIGDDLADAVRAGRLSDMMFQPFSARLAALTLAQSTCERYVSTPVPFAYTLLLHRTATLFCVLLPFGLVSTLGMATPLVAAILAYAFFGLDAISSELEVPFGTTMNGLALDAIVRGVEIDLLEALGVADLPEPLHPVRFVLT